MLHTAFSHRKWLSLWVFKIVIIFLWLRTRHPPPPRLPWMRGANQLKVPDDCGIINVCSGGGYILDILSNLLLCLTWDVITRRHQQLLPSVSTPRVSVATAASQPLLCSPRHPLLSEPYAHAPNKLTWCPAVSSGRPPLPSSHREDRLSGRPSW